MKHSSFKLIASVLVTAAAFAASNTATARPAHAARMSSTDPADDPASRLMDFAQTQFPQYFPSSQPNQSADSWVYRFYPETGAYLIVDGQKIFVAGPPFGNLLRYVGLISQFIATGTAPLITASQLSRCPDGSYSSNDFYRCMTGRLEGAQVFDSSKPCSFEIKTDGAMSIASGATAFQSKLPYASAIYSKTSSLGRLTVKITTIVGTDASTLDIASNDNAAPTFFTSGGSLKVEARTLPSGENLSCTFNVTAN